MVTDNKFSKNIGQFSIDYVVAARGLHLGICISKFPIYVHFMLNEIYRPTLYIFHCGSKYPMPLLLIHVISIGLLCKI